jgi:hypothetical protein
MSSEITEQENAIGKRKRKSIADHFVPKEILPNKDRVEFDDIQSSVTLRGALFGMNFWRVVLDEVYLSVNLISVTLYKGVFINCLMPRIQARRRLKQHCFWTRNIAGV